MTGRIAILGAGNGGCAAAADLTRRGFDVTLFTRSETRLAPIRERGGLEYIGVVGDGFAPLKTVTTNIDEALEGVDLIMITTPTNAHAWYAQLLAPRLKENHFVMLNPGHTGGGLHFVHSLRAAGFQDDVKCCETITLTYGCRMPTPVQVRILAVMTRLRLSAFPGKHIDELTPKIATLFPNVVPAANVLETGLTNLNAMEHPPGMLLNTGWIEFTQGDFRFYYEGITPSVAKAIQALDDERMAVVQTLNKRAGLSMHVMTFIEYFYQAGFTSERALKANDMYLALQDSEPNKPVKSPPSLAHRYVDEDVGYGLVPIYEIGRMVGVEMPVTRLMIDLASLLRGVDYWQEGLTLAKMGLDRVPVARLGEFLYEGRLEATGG
ncbi:MAG: NAD/NADP octopine/nopaline dehydrogenase family protein [Ardenticatenaceae bacterium]|nr:NAD/NADP octopine/nopaline dehydrogenase family protein [Ardenticatenaceae bacterium]